MKLRKILILTLFMISPIISFAQKAYEMVEYNSTVNGMVVKLSLADGYLVASKITLISKNKKASIFNPENGVADNNGKLKFIPYTAPLKPTKAHFILSGLQDSFSIIPLTISGKYNDGNKQYSLIFKKKNKL